MKTRGRIGLQAGLSTIFVNNIGKFFRIQRFFFPERKKNSQLVSGTCGPHGLIRQNAELVYANSYPNTKTALLMAHFPLAKPSPPNPGQQLNHSAQRRSTRSIYCIRSTGKHWKFKARPPRLFWRLCIGFRAGAGWDLGIAEDRWSSRGGAGMGPGNP